MQLATNTAFDIPLETLSETNGFFYLASPYTGTLQQMEDRVEEVWRQLSILTFHGIRAYSPIWACHRTSLYFNLPVEVEFWERMNLPFLDACCGLIIAAMPGWKTSKGVQGEYTYIRLQGKPTYITHLTDNYDMLGITDFDGKGFS